MCSNNDECGGGEVMEQKINIALTGSRCKKCTDDQVPADVLLRGKDTYCRSCLVKSVSHKFRAALGKSKMVKPGDKILVGFSGSQACTALLHLVKEGLAEASHKRFLFEPYVVYIDEGAALGMSLEHRKQTIEEIRNILNNYNFPSYVSVLRTFTLPVSTDSYIYYSINNLEVNVPNDCTVQEAFSKIDLSSKEDLLQKLRQNILVSMADTLGCSKIFTAETSGDLAIRLLSNISLGRGSQLFFDVGFCDTRDSQIRILRPMKDITKKEIAMYSVFSKLQSVHVPSFRTCVDEHASIQKLTEKFVTELQNDFPATTSTVFRTGEKLSSYCNDMKDLEKCLLCKAPMDTFEIASSSLQATNFSRLVSKSLPENLVPEGNFVKDTDICEAETQNYNHTSSAQQTNGISSQEYKKLLCYGCQIIFKETDLGNLLQNSQEEVHQKLMNDNTEVLSNCIL